MRREIETYLNEWRTSPVRLPLLVRGARQVGKSFSITQFGESHFKNCLVVNFDLNPEYKDCFTSLEPKKIIEQIVIMSGQKIIAGETLLFLDEIQGCPNALHALRYFYEKLPELHVIGAGSLLEFALASEDFQVPVGRVQYLFMQPLSFGEFLDAIGEGNSKEYVGSLTLSTDVPPALHTKLTGLVKRYLMIGGMPAVVNSLIVTGNISKCFEMQSVLTQNFRDDFGKYASRVHHEAMQKVFYAAARMVGQKFKYVNIDQHIQSRELKHAMTLITWAGIMYQVRSTSGEGIPLEIHANEKRYKSLFVDVGLMQNICGLSQETVRADDIVAVFAGALAEQFVGQELIALKSKLQPPSIFYWSRENAGGNAEVDYLYVHNSAVLPLEVKYGATGSLKSMHLFLEQYGRKPGIRISRAPLSFDGTVLSVPLYAISRLSALIAEATGS